MTFAGLFFLGLSIWLLGLLFAEPLIEAQIRKTFQKQTAGKYLLEFDNFSIAYRNRGIEAKNLRLFVNPDSVEALVDEDIFNFSCDEILITGPHLYSILFRKKISAEEVALTRPVMKMERTKNRPVGDDSKAKKNFGGIQFYRILATGGSAVIKEKETGRLLFSSPRFNIFCEDFALSPGLIPVYKYFAFEGHENAMTLFGGNEMRIADLFIAGGPEYTGLNAAGLDIKDIDAPLREALNLGRQWDFSLERISLETPSLLNLIEEVSTGKINNIHLNKVLFSKPRLFYTTQKESTEPKKPEFTGEPVKLNLPDIDRLGVYDGEFLWMQAGQKRPVLSVEKLNFTITGLRTAPHNHIPVIYKTFELFSGKTESTPIGWEYTFHADSWHYRSATDSLGIFGISALPHKSLDSFHLDKKWRIDRFEFTTDTLLISNTNLPKFGLDGTFSPDTVLFLNPSLKAYTDKRMIHDPGFIKPYPVAILKSIPGKFEIKLIELRNSKAEYSEKVAGTPGIGTLRMEKGNLRITGVKSNFTDRDTAVLHYTCSFGGESRGEIKVVIPLESHREVQLVSGSLHNLPFKNLNTITENTVLFGFTSGVLDSAFFRFFAENGKSKGTSYFYYRDLKVKIYKVVEVPSYNSKILMGKGFVSLAANLLINKSNPTPEEYSISGPIEFKRDMVKGPLNFWIKSVMTGLMNTVIDDISDLKDLQEEVAELKTSSQTGLLSKMKSDPAKRKARRVAREARKVTNADEMK